MSEKPVLYDQSTARRLAKEYNANRAPGQNIAVAHTWPIDSWGGQEQGWVVGLVAEESLSTTPTPQELKLTQRTEAGRGSMSVHYSHAAPFIRRQLCYAVYSAKTAQLKRDQARHWGEARGLGVALEIMADSQDQTPMPGIAEEDNLPRDAVRWTWEFLGLSTGKDVFGTEAPEGIFPEPEAPVAHPIPQIPAFAKESAAQRHDFVPAQPDSPRYDAECATCGRPDRGTEAHEVEEES